MSRQFNTDGLMASPPDNGEPVRLNAFKSIECAISFDVRDWSEDRRSAWIYAIVFGWDDEDSWDEVAKKFGWDEKDRKIANIMHEQWIKAKETKEQLEIIKCKDCKYCVKEPNGELYCDILAVGYEPLGSKKVNADWFCADGERR